MYCLLRCLIFFLVLYRLFTDNHLKSVLVWSFSGTPISHQIETLHWVCLGLQYTDFFLSIPRNTGFSGGYKSLLFFIPSFLHDALNFSETLRHKAIVIQDMKYQKFYFLQSEVDHLPPLFFVGKIGSLFRKSLKHMTGSALSYAVICSPTPATTPLRKISTTAIQNVEVSPTYSASQNLICEAIQTV